MKVTWAGLDAALFNVLFAVQFSWLFGLFLFAIVGVMPKGGDGVTVATILTPAQMEGYLLAVSIFGAIGAVVLLVWELTFFLFSFAWLVWAIWRLATGAEREALTSAQDEEMEISIP